MIISMFQDQENTHYRPQNSTVQNIRIKLHLVWYLSLLLRIKGLWKKRVIRSAFFEAGPGSYDIPHSIGALPKYQLRDKKKKIKLYESEEQTPNIMV